MAAISLIQELYRRRAFPDLAAAVVMLLVSFSVWIYLLTKITVIDYDWNDVLLLLLYAATFLFAFVVAPILFLLVLLQRRSAHYYEAVVSPLKFELSLRKTHWFVDSFEVREVIKRSNENFINHNLSLIYRNLLLSLFAYAFHRISAVIYVAEQPVQISILTATIIILLLLDSARRANRIYAILRGVRIVLSKLEGPKLGPSSSAERWSSLEARPMQDQRSKGPLEFGSAEFDMLLDEETKQKLQKINSRSEDEVFEGLVKTGVYTPDGKLTKIYGGSEQIE